MNSDRSARTAASTMSTRLRKACSCTPWQAMQTVTRALRILLCQEAPTQARGPKPEFCSWLLPPRHSGDRVAKVETDAVSLPALSLSAAAPEAPAVPLAPVV